MDYKKTQEIILKGVNTLCDPVKITLGTKGRTVLYDTFRDERKVPNVSKDGASIAKHIMSEHGYENMVISIVRESSLKTMLSAGDGTTTTCIIAQSLIQNGMELLNSGLSYYEINKGIDEAVKNVKDYLYNNTTYINDNIHMLREIASISANDESIGELIYDVIKEIGVLGNIQVERSYFNETRVETTKGMKTHKGWLDASMCNNTEKETFEADNCYVLIVNEEIKDWNFIFEYVKEVGDNPLVVFCDDVSDQMMVRLRKHLASTKIPLCFVENDGYLERKEILLDDIAIITGGEVIQSIDGFHAEYLGFAEKILVTKTHTSIMGGDTVEELAIEEIANIKRLLESDRLSANNEMTNMEKLFYQRRLANYTGGVAIIKVGGRTEVEMRELKDRFDDAVLAVESAVRDGISLGGGYTFLNCSKKLQDSFSQVKNNKQAYQLVLTAIEAPFKQLLLNSDLYAMFNSIKETIIHEDKGFDLRTNSFVEKNKFRVYDATAVLVDALINGAAVAKSLLSVKEIIYEGIRLT